MVRDLFIGFVDEPWLADIDFATLEHMQGHFVTDDLRDRENAIIWRGNIKGQRVYVYILLEFQSGVDKFMEVRMMGYLALLYQDYGVDQTCTVARPLAGRNIASVWHYFGGQNHVG